MRLPSQRWLKAVLVATALVFVGVAVYVYAFGFFAWVESDASVTALLARKAIDSTSPVVTDWFYANGDVWTTAPHLFAIIPVAIFGLGPVTLQITVVLGFALELFGFVKLYERLAGERWVAVFAAMVTLIGWSGSHVGYEYIQLAYGCFALLGLVAFTLFAILAESPPTRSWRWVVAGLVVALVSVQNPTRALAYVFAPIIAAACWPWRDFALRRRLLVAAVAVVAWGIAFVVYRKLLAPVVAFSTPRGALDFAFVDASTIVANLGRFARGLAILCGGGGEASVRSIPGLLVLAGALSFVVRDALASRALGALRFVGIAVLAQTGFVLVPMIFGNLLGDLTSTRYLLPSLVPMLGLAAIHAVRTLDSASAWRKIAIGWLVAVPITAALAIPEARPPTPEPYVWPDGAELDRVAQEIERRGLTHGYANILGANLLTLDTHGTANTCPVMFADSLFPQRWLTDTSCFRASALPDRFFVVAYQNEHDRAALRATLPPPVDRFSVGETYEVSVYRKADGSLDWLDLPLPENDKSAFPLQIAATHLQLRRANATVDGRRLVATGQPGTVVYGPYIRMPRGRYTATWFGNGLPSPGAIRFFVLANGKDQLAEATLATKDLPAAHGQLGQLKFKIQSPRDAIEFSVYSQDGGRVALDELRIETR